MLRHKGGLTIPTSVDVPRIFADEGVAALAKRFRDLLKGTEALPEAAALTATEIASEIDAVRDGRFGQVPGKSRCIH
jgi:hypothetical protein